MKLVNNILLIAGVSSKALGITEQTQFPLRETASPNLNKLLIKNHMNLGDVMSPACELFTKDIPITERELCFYVDVNT